MLAARLSKTILPRGVVCRPQAPGSIIFRPFSSTEEETNNTNAEKGTGFVKSYSSFDGFGFITLQGSDGKKGKEEVFVHRNDLVANLPLDQLPQRFPYLRAKERVQFQMEAAPAGKNHRRAINVKFADGRPIPAVRKNFWISQQHRHNTSLGEKVRAILTDDAMPEEEQKFQAIQDVWATFASEEEMILDVIKAMGLNVDDYKGENYNATGGRPNKKKGKPRDSQQALFAAADAAIAGTSTPAETPAEVEELESTPEEETSEEKKEETSSSGGWGSLS